MSEGTQFTLPVIAPFSLDLTVWTLRRRAKNVMDHWDGIYYSRIFVVNNKTYQLFVSQVRPLELDVKVNGFGTDIDVKKKLEYTLQKVLGVNCDLASFYLLAEDDPRISSLVRDFRGMKPPRFPSVFEALVNAISCQQISLDAGISVLNRLTETFGLPFESKDCIYHAFPRPEDLYQRSEDDIKKLGYSSQKARFIISLASLLMEKPHFLEEMEKQPRDDILESLLELKGIGRWTAEYALLRGFGRIDVLPGDDVGAQKNLMILLNLENRPKYDEIAEIIRSWQPYAGLIYFHLLLNSLQKKLNILGVNS